MLQLPYINTRAHIGLIMKNYDEFARQYNAEIAKKRDEDVANRIKYQTLKPTHRELFNDLVMELGKNMLSAIKLYEKLQKQTGDASTFEFKRNNICGDGFFVCSTNRYQIAKHNQKELSTIYRNIRRLMEAGIILDKTGHGHFSDFDLKINADFLLVSDKSNPDYNPAQSAENQNFSFSEKFAFCKAEKKEKEQLINIIYSAKAESGDFPEMDQENTKTFENGKIEDDKSASQPENSNESEINPTTGTVTGTRGKIETVDCGSEGIKRTFKPTGGVADIMALKEERGYDWKLSKQNPAHWHAFHRLTHSAYFIDYLIERIYNHRGIEIIPEARIRAIEYAEKFYFPSPIMTDERNKTIYHPCITAEDYSQRLAGLKWCIDAANRYAAKKGTFFVLPMQYIDIENKNGLTGTLQWFKNHKQNEKDKQTHLKNIKDIKNLNNQIRMVFEKPDQETFRQAETYVKNNLVKYIGVFHSSLATVKQRFK